MHISILENVELLQVDSFFGRKWAHIHKLEGNLSMKCIMYLRLHSNTLAISHSD